MDIAELAQWFENIEKDLSKKQLAIGSRNFKRNSNSNSIFTRCWFGLFTLDRTSKSLSGGEAQRIRLATQIGSQLVGVLIYFR